MAPTNQTKEKHNMCGIGGFSLSKQSKINPRKVGHALLTEMETRGSMASGYAWENGKSSGIFKRDIAGSKLNMWHMARNTKNAILHTRLATHGSVSVNENNHPVMSPNGKIALVHNGVIYNHSKVRGELPYQLPEVDTSVIPAILQKYGADKFSMLDGDAAVAWLDSGLRNQITVARISHSPLWVAQSKDGSFFFASTEHILCTALDRVGIDYEWVYEVAERKMFTVSDGVVTTFEDVAKLDPAYEEIYAPTSYSKYRHLTSGGKTGVWTSYGTGIEEYIPGDEDFDWIDRTPSNDDLATWGIKTFADFKACFSQVGDSFYDGNGEYIGDEEALMEEYEDFRYSKWQDSRYGPSEKDLWGRIDSWD
jgi:predicted glutamine amidotransferase